MLKNIFKFTIGFIIILALYHLSIHILNLIKCNFPPTIFTLILFTILLSTGIIKKSWVKISCEFFLQNMPILFVPFIVGLILYKETILKNWLLILIVVTITTILTISLTGLFVEYGIKYLRLFKIRGKHD